ncbi:MAG: hypothetical protein HY253_14825 [Burkholderiales bacterium]|nr:hypothetical protein [Burkholderiales bacterium]
MYIATTTHALGPFKHVDVLADRLIADGTHYQLSILGEYKLLKDSDYTPPPDLVALQREIVNSTQGRLDAFARARGYDSILSACTYVTSQIPKFAHEGQMAVQSRDATWAKLYQILADVEAHKRPVPTCFADVEADLPALNWE